MNDFVKLMIDTAKGAPKVFSVSESNEKIREQFNKILGLNENYSNKEMRKAVRLHKAEVFNLIEEVLDDMLVSGWEDNPFFREFVEVRNLADGDKNIFTIPDKSILTVSKFSGNSHSIKRQKLGAASEKSISTSWYGIKFSSTTL